MFARSKPKVPTSTTCPKCLKPAAVGVRTAGPFTRFWFCNKGCGWASWRPPARLPCVKCAGPTIWAASRLSISCYKCGHRVRLDSLFTV
jgi:hypothetical protein